MPGEWIRRPQDETSAVFVHGILSSGEKCWRHDNGSYWPELLKNEQELGSLGVYVFTYETGIFSGSYRLGDIVDDLKEYLGLHRVLASKQLIFVCHSMGGIVVRKYIVERQAELIGARKEINLFLVASPSLGATYADWLSPLAQLFGHAQADALRFVRNNNWLMDLDKEFVNLKEGGKPKIKGKELVEDKFVVLSKFWGRQVVEPFSGARYFGESYKVPESDHFSIAKPDNKDAIQHLLLCKFILENAFSPGPEIRNGLKPKHEPATTIPEPLTASGPGLIFLSYASEDIAAALQIRSELEDNMGAGVLWFDKPSLTPEWEWDMRILEDIQRCDFFLAVVSANIEKREKGHFWKEWREALERKKRICGEFIFPVVIDEVWSGKPEDYKTFPNEFYQLQFSHAPEGKIGEDLRDVIKKALAIRSS